MDFFGSYKSPFGYTSGDNGVDSYGVDHSGFSTQDELQYQTLRTNREEELKKNFEQQGIMQENYPQYGTNFWGNSDNNYGFGTSNIAQNVQNHPAMAVAPMQNLSQQQNNVTQALLTTSPQNYLQQDNNIGNPFNFANNQKALLNVIQGYNYLSPLRINDKYKHSVLSCLGAQGGIPSTIAVAGAGIAKEIYDIAKKSTTPEKYGGYGVIIRDSSDDLQADAKGLLEGYINPNGNCYNLMQNSYPINTK